MVNPEGIIFLFNSVQICAYLDDTVIIARDMTSLNNVVLYKVME